MLFQTHTFNYKDMAFTILSNYSPDMTFGLVEDALRSNQCKTASDVSDFIHAHLAKSTDNRRVYSDIQWNERK